MCLRQLTKDLISKIRSCAFDSDLPDLGFEIQGRLCTFTGYENYEQNLWLWTRIESEDVYCLVTLDNGDNICRPCYYNIFVPEIFN